jgi:hypothetical protein
MKGIHLGTGFKRRWTGILLCLVSFGILSLYLSAAASLPKQGFLPLVWKNWPLPSPTLAPARALISEVLYDPTGSEPEGEWVEIYNPGDIAYDLSGCKFGDEEIPGGQEGMLQFPSGTWLLPGQTLLVANRATTFQANYAAAPDFEMRASDPDVPDLVKYLSWANGNVEFVNTGDEALLLDPNDRVIDAVSWGNSNSFLDPAVARVSEGSSLERRPAYVDTDSAGDWFENPVPQPWLVDIRTPTPTSTSTPTPTRRPTLTLTPSPSATPAGTFVASPIPGNPADLLVSEVYYYPPGFEPAGEWIEIYNPGNSPVALGNVMIGDEVDLGGGEGMFRFPDTASLAPRGVALVANSAVVFMANYGFQPDFEIAGTDSNVADLTPVRSWASGSMNLSNAGDEVLLLDGSYQLIDAVSWGNSVWAFFPSVASAPQGYSLERKPANQDTDSAADWNLLSAPAPGSVDLSLPLATNTPTPSPILSPTASPTNTASATPSPTQTRTPTITHTPTPTNTPIPTPPEARLLISEILYDPVALEPAQEWIEIYNAGGSALDISGFKLGDEETRGQIEAMLVFPAGTLLAPGQVLVIANQAASFKLAYVCTPDFEIEDTLPGVPDLEPYLQWSSGSLNLNNFGDEVLILNASDQPVDTVSWGTSDWAFDPAAARVPEGHSLARCPSNLDTDTYADWCAQQEPNPGQVDWIKLTLKSISKRRRVRK